MHETRNFCLVLALVVFIVWAIIAWTMLGGEMSLLWPQRILSLVFIALTGAWLFYALRFEDKLPDHLMKVLGEEYYYEVDGLCFMPIIRVNGGRSELSVYYQNRYENPVEVIVHLRPPVESFIIRPGMRDVHFAFTAQGGDFGVIHQPIAVPEPLQGDVINVELAAASYYPRSHGARMRRRTGISCGTLPVDWGGAAFKAGVHEVSGEIELINPVTIHLSMPTGVKTVITGDEVWKQEQLVAGTTT